MTLNEIRISLCEGEMTRTEAYQKLVFTCPRRRLTEALLSAWRDAHDLATGMHTHNIEGVPPPLGGTQTCKAILDSQKAGEITPHEAFNQLENNVRPQNLARKYFYETRRRDRLQAEYDDYKRKVSDATGKELAGVRQLVDSLKLVADTYLTSRDPSIIGDMLDYDRRWNCDEDCHTCDGEDCPNRTHVCLHLRNYPNDKT